MTTNDLADRTRMSAAAISAMMRPRSVAIIGMSAKADEMNGPLELVVGQKLKDDTTRRSRLGGHADDRHAPRTHHGADG